MDTLHYFTYPAERYNENDIETAEIVRLVRKHREYAGRLHQLENYYKGRHKILHDEKKKDNPLVCNHAKDISDTASSYFIGNPITYKSEEDISFILEKLESAGADEADGDNGLDLSIYGVAYEYVYAKEKESELTIKNLPPQNTFIVRDDTIEENELFAVYYFGKKDDARDNPTKYTATILTEHYRYTFNLDFTENTADETGKEPHYFGEVPVIEYLNNKLAIGDFELQIPLIDAYNALMSNRITDKEQFVDAILAIYGAILSDNEKGSNEAMQTLQKEKLLELPNSTKAEYLTRTFDESGVEILKKAVEQDIHKFSHVPCMTDENFGGNVSGVAMEFKLLGMENITKIKTRYYRKGIRKRLRLFSNFYRMKGMQFNASTITAVFTRGLPKNLLEISQIVSNLWGKVSKKTLYSQIPFIENVEAEIEAVEKESKENIRQQRELFGEVPNELPDIESGEEDSKE